MFRWLLEAFLGVQPKCKAATKQEFLIDLSQEEFRELYLCIKIVYTFNTRLKKLSSFSGLIESDYGVNGVVCTV